MLRKVGLIVGVLALLGGLGIVFGGPNHQRPRYANTRDN